jgi:tetratricopeptide (TPR) repeat protein
MTKHHETAQEIGKTNWNLARIAIMYQLAETQYKVGDYDKCVDTLREAFATKAPFAPMYILAAKVDIERGNLEPAANQLNAAIRINPAEPEPYYLLGVIHQRWQKSEAACDYYKQAWSKKTDEVRYLLAVVEMEISLGRLDEAQAILESKIVYFEQTAAVRVALARIASLKNDYPAACKYYRDAVTLTPDDKSLARTYAESLFYAARFADAAPLLEDIRKNPDLADRANVLTMLGQCYLELHRPQDARNCFQEVIRLEPNDNLAYINLGKACIQTGELGISLSAAKKVLHNDPQNVHALIVIALVQQKQKKWNDAAATLEKASKIAPMDGTIFCMRGLNAQQQGNHQQAVAFYEKAAQANPRDPWAAELLGRPLSPTGAAPQPASPSADQPAPSPAAVNRTISDLTPTIALTPVEAPAITKAP